MSLGRIRVSQDLLREFLRFPEEWQIRNSIWIQQEQCIELLIYEDDEALIQFIPHQVPPPLVQPIIRRYEDGRVRLVEVRIVEEPKGG